MSWVQYSFLMSGIAFPLISIILFKLGEATNDEALGVFAILLGMFGIGCALGLLTILIKGVSA